MYLAEYDWNTDYTSSTPMFHVDVVHETRDSDDGTSKHHEAVPPTSQTLGEIVFSSECQIQTKSKLPCPGNFLTLSNRFSALSSDESRACEVDTTCDEMVPEASEVSRSDLEQWSTYESDTEAPSSVCLKEKSKRSSQYVKRQRGCVHTGGSTSRISETESSDVNYLGTSSSSAQELNNLEHVGWIEIKGVMDSGAADSVAPPTVLPLMPISPSNGSAVGQTYLTANGTKLANLGEKKLNVITNDLQENSMTYQMVDVTRPLNSISRICDNQNFVVFHRDGGWVENEWTGQRTHFDREGGIYTTSAWIRAPVPPFQGQGA